MINISKKDPPYYKSKILLVLLKLSILLGLWPSLSCGLDETAEDTTNILKTTVSIDSIPKYAQLPLEISSITQQGVMLRSTDQLADISLNRLQLCHYQECYPIEGVVDANALEIPTTQFLGISQNQGAFAVVDTVNYWIHAYYYWGATEPLDDPWYQQWLVQ